jgi:hypothetical protein
MQPGLSSSCRLTVWRPKLDALSVVPRGGQVRIAYLLILLCRWLPTLGHPRVNFRRSSDPIMLTTILAYVIAAVGLGTILAGGWSFVMLTIQDYPRGDLDFRDLVNL